MKRATLKILVRTVCGLFGTLSFIFVLFCMVWPLEMLDGRRTIWELLIDSAWRKDEAVVAMYTMFPLMLVASLAVVVSAVFPDKHSLWRT